MKKIIISLICLLFALSANAKDHEGIVTENLGVGAFTLISQSQPVSLIVADSDKKGVLVAARNLQKDFERVCGKQAMLLNAPSTNTTRYVIAGSLESPYVKQMVKAKKINEKELKGKVEKYIMTVVNNPIPGVDEALVIAGSDMRGTIYGIYELSEQIGVSPWYDWMDVPPVHHENLAIQKGTYTAGEPAVRYRGIFINDEWPSFGTWCNNRFGGVNSKAYTKLFELLLRLKANYFWPAMWASAFNEDDPLSPKVADEMGIVMGTSHHEPMMRAHKEYTKRRDEVGPWDYARNPERIEKFFTEGIEKSKDYENIITIGMRGDGDVAMGTGNDADNIKTLKDVISAQRRIISKVHGKKASDVPQLWAIFTEVQRYYDAGFTVPDDVTLLFCDNNWGYIRRMGGERERNRKGGMGMYYHIDMNGGPWNDRWVNTTTVPKLREQLNLAYKSGIDRIWIINVGDLKPKEMPINFIMNYAWNPDAIQPGDEQCWLESFAASIFGNEHAVEIADIIAKYSKYNLWRKPEVQYPGIFNNDEMLHTNALWQSLVVRCENLKAKLPKEAQDAFYQLVYYPVVGSAGVAQIYNYATMGDSLSIEALMEKDRRLTEHYNKGIAGGKWDGMMLDNHIGYTKWSIPEKNVNPMTLGCKVENDLVSKETREYSIPAYKYKNKVDGKDAKWIFLPDLGRGEGCMGSDNVLAASDITGEGASLEYEIDLASGNIAIGILPTQDVYPARGLRLGVQVDDQPMQTIDARQGLVDTFGEYTPQNLASSKVHKPLPPHNNLLLSGWKDGRRLPRRNEVFDNMRWLDVRLNVAPGKHTLRIIMVDPEIVVEQIVVNPDNSSYSYFGRQFQF